VLNGANARLALFEKDGDYGRRAAGPALSGTC
jgi:hypothetical protein